MTEKLRNILVRQSEVRERLNAEIGKDEPDDTKLTSLRNEAQSIETELREALKADDKPDATDDDASDAGAKVDAETRERLELREKCGVSDFVAGALLGKEPTGAAAEYAAAEGCPGLMPITLLGPTTEERRREHREREHRAVTPAPADTDVPHTHAPIVPMLFDRSIAPYLGIMMPTVGTGIQSYPVLSTAVTAGMAAEDANAVNTAGAFTVTDADPRRLTGALTIRKEDAAKLPALEESLRGNLASVISDEFDDEALNGDNHRAESERHPGATHGPGGPGRERRDVPALRGGVRVAHRRALREHAIGGSGPGRAAHDSPHGERLRLGQQRQECLRHAVDGLRRRAGDAAYRGPDRQHPAGGHPPCESCGRPRRRLPGVDGPGADSGYLRDERSEGPDHGHRDGPGGRRGYPALRRVRAGFLPARVSRGATRSERRGRPTGHAGWRAHGERRRSDRRRSLSGAGADRA